jgi:CPA1 family monovalent cation:H+ antiporter
VTAFQILAALLTIAATFAYINHRWIGQSPTIALMAMSLAASTILIILDNLGWVHVTPMATRILEQIDLDDTLLHGMLGVLLFAGALHIDFSDLREHKVAIAALAVGATVISSLIVGFLSHVVLGWLGLDVSIGYCMLFGALISPTDPIAVLGILKRAGVPASMEIQIAGESLFNDGVGVVIFLTVLGVIQHHGATSAWGVVGLFAREAIGGAAFGFATGYLCYRLLRSIDHYQTELLLTLALVLGGYAVAEWLHLSAPIAAVVAGLVIGNRGRSHGMSDATRDHLDKFWSLIDEIMNAALFVLIGFELMRVTLTRDAVVAGLCMIPGVLLVRLVSVGAAMLPLSRMSRFAPGSLATLTWGGLRGGISVALALSTPAGRERDLVVTMTYFVVVFSIFVQGLTLGPLVRRLTAPAPREGT